jgi:hypothetical protein
MSPLQRNAVTKPKSHHVVLALLLETHISKTHRSKTDGKTHGARVRRHPHQGFDLRMEDEPEPHRLLGNRTSPPWYRRRVVASSPTLHYRQVPAIMYSRWTYDKQMSNKQTL